jgi:hypothetical protein
MTMLKHTNESQFSEVIRDQEFLITGEEGKMIRIKRRARFIKLQNR